MQKHFDTPGKLLHRDLQAMSLLCECQVRKTPQEEQGPTRRGAQVFPCLQWKPKPSHPMDTLWSMQERKTLAGTGEQGTNRQEGNR
eukprot:1134250-Pelagomonas_calceolata.AAC.15